MKRNLGPVGLNIFISKTSMYNIYCDNINTLGYEKTQNANIVLLLGYERKQNNDGPGCSKHR